MDAYTSQLSFAILGAGAGCVFGGFIVWLAMRGRILAARSEAQNEKQGEIIRLTEKLSGAVLELTNCREREITSGDKIANLNLELSTVRDERARFEERAVRVPVLESQLGAGIAENQELSQRLADAREKLAASSSLLESQHEQIASLEEQEKKLQSRCDQLLSDQEQLKTSLAESAITLDSERNQTAEKLALINDAKEQLTDRFKTLANEILDEKAMRFTEQNQKNIGQILEPLKEKIHEFQEKVDQVYVQEGKDRSALSEQVRQLFDLNQQLSQDANNLADALKGSSKTQGNWGELVLEHILEASGLREGHEYDVRQNYTRADNTRAQPDIVLHLPQEKELVLDSKVSLTAYEEYWATDDEFVRGEAIERHVDSVREHIRELAQQDYQALHGVRSIDFVVMFVPIEPAFALALAHDSKLCEEAWKKNILIVSPTTLLFVLRTVAHLWRQESQNRNVQEIATRGAELYDKLCGFVTDLQEVGKRLDQARTSYDSAYAKFSTGRGNVIRQAETLKKLGVKPSKMLPRDILESALDESVLLPEVTESPDNGPEPTPS
jgi:DNA recombination protein RmuC